MKITERKEVTHVEVEEVIVGRKCDICNKEITKFDNTGNYNYFLIHVWHNDWGNDSIESHRYMDACSPECVLKYVEEYVQNSYNHPYNSKHIEIKHIRSLKEGSWD